MLLSWFLVSSSHPWHSLAYTQITPIFASDLIWLFKKLFYYSYFIQCLVMWHIGSWFPDQGSNLHPVHWKHGVLTTRPSGNPPHLAFCINFLWLPKYHKLGGLQQKCIVSQFWKLEIQNQGVSRVILSLMVLGRKLRKSFRRWQRP